MKEQLISEFLRLLRPEDLLTMVESHTIITDVGFATLMHHGKFGTNSSWDHDANLLFQMTILKSLSLIKHTTPLNHVNSIDGSKLNNVFDPFSMHNIVRAQYEAVCNFNNIFIQSKNENELKLKYLLWVVSGLNYRQRFKVIAAEHQQKQQDELKQIGELTAEITSNPCFIQLDPQSQKNIYDGIKKRDWQFKIDRNKANKIAWHEMMTNAGANDMLEGQYASLSLNTHPSNVSVFQFGSMYTGGMQVFNTRMAVQLSKIFTALLIRDYVTYFKLNKHFDSLPHIPQMLVNSYNTMFREESFKLNDINNILN